MVLEFVLFVRNNRTVSLDFKETSSIAAPRGVPRLPLIVFISDRASCSIRKLIISKN